MGDVIGCVDWSRTILGPVASWSDDLAAVQHDRVDDNVRRLFVALVSAFDRECKRSQSLEEKLDRLIHELRTPLALLVGPIEDALDARESLAGASLETAHRNALLLLELADNAQDLSRIDHWDASFEPTDLRALTVDLAGVFRSTIERAGLRLDLRAEPMPEPVYVDRALWEKIVFTLLSNAIKNTREGRIEIALRSVGRTAELLVSDTGSRPEPMARAFDRPHREWTPATCFGLALVRELANVHGGDVSLDGSSVRVVIPFGAMHLRRDQIAPRSSSMARVRSSSSSEPHPRPGEADIKILYVSGNTEMRSYVTGLLASHFDVDTAETTQEALEAIAKRDFDLVLTDTATQSRLKLVRTLKELSTIPVVLLTGRLLEEASADTGADDYITEPFSRREIIARLSTHADLGRKRRLAESDRARFSELLERAPVPITVIEGPDLRITFQNAYAARQLGATRKLGVPFLQAFPELAGQAVVNDLLQVFETGKPSTVAAQHVRIRGASGEIEERYFDSARQPLLDASGEVIGVVAADIDVTDQVLARRKLEDVTQTKDAFLAMLGHELRNPLSPILTALQLMRLRGMQSREQEIIERQVSHLTRLVDDLLDVSRITRGKVELRRRPIELADVVARAIEITSPLLERRRHRLEVRIPQRGLGALVDVDRMAQVISNLLTNAAKYSDRGSRILVYGRQTGDSVQIGVRDEGEGIEPEMLDRVFDMFVQQSQTIDRAKGGLGLGLAIVRSLVTLHGGVIRAKSEGRGRGSDFLVELPAVEVQPVARPTPLPPRERTSSCKRVLLVDDNEDAAETMTEALGVLGYEVLLASDGPSALGNAQAFAPDIALLDIELPVMDGYELASRIKEMLPSVRLVAVTGYGLEADRIRSAAAGFDRHLVKPVDLHKLGDVIKELCG